MKTVQSQRALDEAIGRSAAYGVLARAFGYPDAGQRAGMAELTPALASAAPAIGAEISLLAGSIPAWEELGGEYGRQFTHSSSRDCPPWETAYAAKEIFQQTQQMADIAGFYRAFGVQSTPGAERVDHIGSELEFMQFMAAKEAYAYRHMGVARVRQCRKAQRLFLRDHLGCWGPSFGRRLAALDPSGWYGRAGSLLDRWLTEECRLLDVTPARTADEPVLPLPEPDEDGPDFSAPVGNGEFGGCPLTGQAGERGSRWTGYVPLPLLES